MDAGAPLEDVGAVEAKAKAVAAEVARLQADVARKCVNSTAAPTYARPPSRKRGRGSGRGKRRTEEYGKLEAAEQTAREVRRGSRASVQQR